jgi:phage terminase large subunit-like protein
VIKKHPGRIAGIVVEVNQGGDLWVETLSPLGLKVITTWSGEPKHVRMASGLDLYQKPRPLVVHARKFPKLEAQMIGYPIGVHDDVADVVCIGVLAFLKPVKGRTVGASVESYR